MAEPAFLSLFADRPFRATDEAALQREIAGILTAGGVAFEREVRLTKADRIDFLVDGNVGLEVKVAGSRADVIRQLFRYAESHRLTHLVLASTRWAHAAMPPAMLGKPVSVLPLYRGTL